MLSLGVDKGGIKFVLKGADVFAPGITSKGGSIPQPLESNVAVCITGEGKELPIAIGVTIQSTTEMMTNNDGVGVETLHFVGDDLWKSTMWKS